MRFPISMDIPEYLESQIAGERNNNGRVPRGQDQTPQKYSCPSPCKFVVSHRLQQTARCQGFAVTSMTDLRMHLCAA